MKGGFFISAPYKIFSKGASTKNFCHAERILAVKGVGGWVNPLKKKICDENLFYE